MDSIAAVQDALKASYASVGKPRSVLTGLSGGADSVALLLSLCELRKEEELSVYAVHVNHGLRANAALDEAYCVALCQRLDVPLVLKRVNITQQSNIEAAAREARYAAFEEAMLETHADMLALAHHADDQAETVIMHLLYGAGPTGLSGMREVREYFWRPLLNVRGSELKDYLTQKAIVWREDESNLDPSFTRNHIRLDIMPKLEACYPNAIGAIVRAAQIMQQEDDFLESKVQEWLSKHASNGLHRFLLLKPLSEQHPAMQRRILRRYADQCGIPLDYQQTERLIRLMREINGVTENLPSGWQALKTGERLHYLKPFNGASVDFSAESLQIGEYNDAFSGTLFQYIPIEQSHDLQLRTRKAGDYIQPFGMHGTKPLKEYMIDHEIDRPFRAEWPLVCRGNEVLWVVGIGASEKLRVSKGDTTVKCLIYTGKLPDQI